MPWQKAYLGLASNRGGQGPQEAHYCILGEGVHELIPETSAHLRCFFIYARPLDFCTLHPCLQCLEFKVPSLYFDKSFSPRIS